MLNLRSSRAGSFVHWKTFLKSILISGVFGLASMLGLLLTQTSLYASGPISSVFTTTTVATPFTYIGSDGNTYNWGQGDDLRITGFQFNATDFVLESPASQVIIRRVDNLRASGEPCGIFVEKTATYAFPASINYEATSPDDGAGNCDLASVIAGDIINRGALDVFDNFNGTSAKNIERIDFIFPEGLIPPSDPLLLAETGHVVTEKSGNNPVKIAAILSLDDAGNPASYGNLIRVDKASDPNVDVAYGFPGLGAEFDFLINNQNPPHQTLIKVGQSVEGLGIAFVTLDDLGVGAGVKYFGFSYFGADIDDTVHTLADVATFPTNTAEADVNEGDADIYGGTAGYFVNQALINQQPDAVDDTATTTVNTGINIDVLANDADPDAGDELTLSIISQPPNGTVTLNDGGTPADPTDDSIDYLPNADFAGEDSFDYQVSDGATGSSTTDIATVTVTVQGPPDAVDDTALTDLDSPVNIDVLNNDTDPNNDGLSISTISNPANGTAVINDAGTPGDETDDTIDYTPDTGFVGDDSFTYDVSDGQGGVSSATVTVTVNAVPTATDDAVVTAIDTAVVIDVVDNDSDQNNDPLIITVTVPPTNGTAIVNDGGTPADPTDDTIEYTPDTGFEGPDSFTYQIDDGNGGVDTATVTVTVSDDADGDGTNDAIDLDDDNDGIPDTVEGTDDFDGDGIPNNLDLDSDGDGILDLAESGLSDAEIAALDTDADGVIDATQSFGANGLADGVETAADSGEVDYDNDGVADDPRNTDGDANPDFLDLDSDNDGVTDVIEAGLGDVDGDGEADAGQTPILVAPDTDGDGVKDIHDLDSDNDGVTDATEAGLADSDGNGLVDGFTDADGDGYDDATAATPAVLPDTDGDGVNDIHDLDSDNDGVTDTTEAGLLDADGDGRIDGFTDADGDGYDDATAAAPATLPDTDRDGVNDIHDLDSDNDGVTDTTEAGLADVDGDGRIDGFTDADGDGYDDATAAAPATLPDTDGDGVKDIHDLDSDNDGVTDTTEAGLADADGDGRIDGFTDADGDGYDDATAAAPAALPDTDGDGVNDIHDLDSDNDGVTDTIEAGLTDSDEDGRVDGFNDADGDGYDDNTRATPAPLTDSDGDGIPDMLELDSDGDGVTDANEAGKPDADNDGIVDGFVDTDGDGLSDDLGGTGGGTVCSDCSLITGTKGGSFGLNLLLLLVGALAVRKLLNRKSCAFVPAAKVLAVPTLIALMPLTIQAEPSPDVRNFNQRFYLGGSIGLSKLDPDASCPCFGVDDDSDQGFKIHLGYDLTRRFTLEGYYADLGEAGIRNNSDGSHAGEIDYQTYGISLLAYLFNHRRPHESDITKYDDEGLYHREGLSLFGRAGVGGMENSSDLPFERDNDVHYALGGGLEYGWRNGLATRLEYVAYDEDAHMLALGLIKRFGSKEPTSARTVAVTPEPVAVVDEKPLEKVPAPAVVAVDSDADGVVDTADQCPDSAAGAVVDDKGCEKKPEFTGVLEGVNFETASAVLTPQAKTILDRVVGQLKQFPEFKLMLVGHTDNVGNPEKNKALSLERAKSVAAYLQSAGISSARMKYDGLGDTQPRTGNDSKEGRAQNRRVELLPQ